MIKKARSPTFMGEMKSRSLLLTEELVEGKGKPLFFGCLAPSRLPINVGAALL